MGEGRRGILTGRPPPCCTHQPITHTPAFPPPTSLVWRPFSECAASGAASACAMAAEQGSRPEVLGPPCRPPPAGWLPPPVHATGRPAGRQESGSDGGDCSVAKKCAGSLLHAPCMPARRRQARCGGTHRSRLLVRGARRQSRRLLAAARRRPMRLHPAAAAAAPAHRESHAMRQHGGQGPGGYCAHSARCAA